MSKTVRAALVCAFLLSVSARAAQTEPLTIAFAANSVTASHLTPGGQVAAFMMSREPQLFTFQFLQRVEALTAAADGTAAYTPGFPVTEHSVWAFVDVETGRYVIGCPTGNCNSLQKSVPKKMFRTDAAGAIDGMDVPIELAGVYFIRPGLGAWSMTVGDGGDRDEDGAVDGKSRISLEKFISIKDKSNPPKKLRKSDLIFLFAPLSLRFGVLEIEN